MGMPGSLALRSLAIAVLTIVILAPFAPAADATSRTRATIPIGDSGGGRMTSLRWFLLGVVSFGVIVVLAAALFLLNAHGFSARNCTSA